MLQQALRRALLLLSIAAIFSLAGCRPAPKPTAAEFTGKEKVPGVRGGSLSVRITSPPKTFDYIMAADEASLTIGYFLLGGRLVDFDHDNQKYVPGLAESWKTDPDGKTVDVVLRDGIKFSDGHPITAEDVVFTLNALYDPKTGSPIFRDAMMLEGKPIAAAAADPRNLKLTFPVVVSAPESYLYNLAVLPKHVLEPDQQQGKLSAAWSVNSDPARIVTSGPFTVDSVVPGERITLKRNPNYWKKDQNGTQLPYLDTLVLEVVGDANNTFTRLGQGSIDIADRIRPSDYAALKKTPGVSKGFDQGPGLNTDHLWFNQNAGTKDGKPIVAPMKMAWFTDVRFRRAVAAAIDREGIATATLQGLATPLSGLVSPGNRAWAAPDLPKIEYSLDKARGALTEAGFVVRPGAEGPELFDAKGNRVEFTLIVPATNEERKLTAAAIQSDLAKLGIKMQIAPVESANLTERWTQTYDYDAILLGVSLTDTEPTSYSTFLRSDSLQHQWYPKEPKPVTPWETRIDELVAIISRETDPAKRQAAFHEVQTIMAEQLPVIPIVARHIISAANPRVGNYRPSNILPLSLWNADELFVKK
jgi:peptide/nickel transport system substrate-binding protein